MTRRRISIRLVAVLAGLALIATAACAGSDSREVASIAADTGSGGSAISGGFELATRAFDDGGRIPARHTCDGDDRSIPLSWSGAPDGTESYALLFDDPDAPGGTFKHWIIFDIPLATTELTESIDKTERVIGSAIQLHNDFGKSGYAGPCPPEGEIHTYRLFLFAMDTRLGIPSSSSQGRVFDLIEEHALARAELSAVYGR